MSREDLIQATGSVDKILGGGRYQITLESGQQVTAQLSGRMRRFRIRAPPASHLLTSQLRLRIRCARCCASGPRVLSVIGRDCQPAGYGAGAGRFGGCADLVPPAEALWREGAEMWTEQMCTVMEAVSLIYA